MVEKRMGLVKLLLPVASHLSVRPFVFLKNQQARDGDRSLEDAAQRTIKHSADNNVTIT